MHCSTILIISLIFFVDNVDAGTRRRRRNMYNDRPCGPGEKAVLSVSKKRVLNCIQCEINKFRPDEKHSAENCIQCEPGRHSSSDKSYCIGDVCRGGTYGTIGSVGCKECSAGHYSEMAEFKCKECESGRYNTFPKQSTCMGEMCPSGKFGLTAQTNDKNVGICHTCPSGKWSSKGASICTTCPEGKWSPENADHCQNHEKCHRGTYPGASKTITSGDAKCERCIHYSSIYFAAYIYASGLAVLIAIIFLTNMRNTCYMLFFIICPGAWALALVACISTPNDIPAIISLVMNTVVVLPVMRYLHTTAKKWHQNHTEKRQKKQNHPIQNNTHNSIKHHDNKINITADTSAIV